MLVWAKKKWTYIIRVDKARSNYLLNTRNPDPEMLATTLMRVTDLLSHRVKAKNSLSLLHRIHSGKN